MMCKSRIYGKHKFYRNGELILFFGNLNIISGITETRTKDGLVKDNNYYIFLEDFKKYLKNKGVILKKN